MSSGLVSVFVPGSTAAVTTMEYEPGTVRDFHEALERVTEERNVRAAIVGPSETLPVRAGRIDMAARQQIVLIDFDDRSRQRTVIVQVVE